MRAEEVRVRALASDDLDACWEIEREAYPNPWRRDHFDELLDLDAGLGLAAVDQDDGILGYALGWVVTDEAELANIAVEASWRRRGIGARLLYAFAREAERRGAERVWLEVRESNAEARRFYDRHGFLMVGRRRGYYDRPREDAIVMAADPADLEEADEGRGLVRDT
ncbi:MAG: ribosomal protein S18-alanine N-acetyltransferase [Gemmatimonadetes bacterium]|nr:ribosomal protein S18-alanine N-acetyltransferase [Gemmatimonadota bacterium]